VLDWVLAQPVLVQRKCLAALEVLEERDINFGVHIAICCETTSGSFV